MKSTPLSPAHARCTELLERIKGDEPTAACEKLTNAEVLELFLLAQAGTQDKVDHPPHYTVGSIEVIELIEDWSLTFHGGNALKYILRSPYKGRPLEDLKKARWYATRASDVGWPTHQPRTHVPTVSLRRITEDWKLAGGPVKALAGLRNGNWDAVLAAGEEMIDLA